MITITLIDVERLSHIINNEFVKYVIISKSKFYAGHCITEGDMYCDVKNTKITKKYNSGLSLRAIQDFVDQFIFIDNNTKQIISLTVH